MSNDNNSSDDSVKKTEILIIGAGPTALGAASRLIQCTKYKPYFVGKLPPTFGQKEFVDYDENNDKIIKHGKYQWFNYKGLTYLKENPLWEIL